jgi:hypothetical protein
LFLRIKKDTKTEKEVWSNDEDGEDDRDRDGRHYNEKKKERSPPPPKVMNVGVDKLGGFRINLDAAMKKKKRDSAGRDSDSESPRKRKPRRRDSRLLLLFFLFNKFTGISPFLQSSSSLPYPTQVGSALKGSHFYTMITN